MIRAQQQDESDAAATATAAADRAAAAAAAAAVAARTFWVELAIKKYDTCVRSSRIWPSNPAVPLLERLQPPWCRPPTPHPTPTACSRVEGTLDITKGLKAELQKVKSEYEDMLRESVPDWLLKPLVLVRCVSPSWF